MGDEKSAAVKQRLPADEFGRQPRMAGAADSDTARGIGMCKQIVDHFAGDIWCADGLQ